MWLAFISVTQKFEAESRDFYVGLPHMKNEIVFKQITTKGKPSSGYRVLDDLRKFFRQYMVSLWNLAVAPSISCKTGVNHILISKIMYVYIRLRKKLNYNIWLKLFIVFLSSPTKKIKLSILYYWVQCQNISETLDRRSEA